MEAGDGDADGLAPCSMLQLWRLAIAAEGGAMPPEGKELKFLRKSVVGLPT
jgi:hypothetical protein